MKVTVTCTGKNQMAKFTCTGNRVGCTERMNDIRFNSHMRICHPSADAYHINTEARRNGQVSFDDKDDMEGCDTAL